jgi:hypothetical protein
MKRGVASVLSLLLAASALLWAQLPKPGAGGSAGLPANTLTGSGTTGVSTAFSQAVEMVITDTISYTALTSAATSMNVAGAILPAGFKVRGITVTEATQFVCGGCTNTTAMTVSLGPTGSETLYFPAATLFQTAGTFVDYGGHYSSSASSVTLQYRFVNTTGTPGNLGTGSVTNFTAGSLVIRIWGVV